MRTNSLLSFMGFTCIHGSFHVVGYSPDGDSIRFRPDDQVHVKNLQNGARAKFNAQEHVQLRLEAIDSLETHFSAPGGGHGALHQPLELARQAIDGLMTYLQITEVVWNAAHSRVESAQDGVRGCILARSVEKNGRPVAFVFREPPAADGENVHLTAAMLPESYNWQALHAGMAYATFYKGLFADLRTALAEAAGLAREAGSGVYAADGSNTGFDAASLAVITDEVPIMPKLFRRLSDYMVSTGSAAGFVEKLAQAQEPLLDLSTMNFTHFDNVLEQAGTRIRLRLLPEEMVFDETIPLPGPVFAAIVKGALPSLPA